MPGRTGLELAARLRSEGSKIPFLLSTGFVSSGVKSSATLLDVHVLGKPADEDAILDFVEGHVSSAPQIEGDCSLALCAIPRR
jgi:FixJ family two-component response regulator